MGTGSIHESYAAVLISRSCTGVAVGFCMPAAQIYVSIFRLCALNVVFSESEIRFSNLQNRLLQITILNLKFEIPAQNSKQLIQISSSG